VLLLGKNFYIFAIILPKYQPDRLNFCYIPDTAVVLCSLALMLYIILLEFYLFYSY